MKTNANQHETCPVVYQPVLFIIGTFAVTWCCAWFMPGTDYHAHTALFIFLDFMENASPLFCALLLLRRHLTKNRFFHRFFLGTPDSKYSYIIVIMLFMAQFLNFYLFQAEDAAFSVQSFALTFIGQFLLGGGLEEAGWRGYLLPCFCRKQSYLLSSVLVSVIWVLWHLPYFFIPGSMQAGENFLFYAITGMITGFILTAIWLLTKSILLCMLFHSWQNTIVMTVQADMSDVRFMLMFLLLGVFSVLICISRQKKRPFSSHT